MNISTATTVQCLQVPTTVFVLSTEGEDQIKTPTTCVAGAEFSKFYTKDEKV